MTKTPKELISELQAINLSLEEVDFKQKGYHLDVKMDHSKVLDFAKTMRANDLYLVFVTAVHVKPSVQVIYQFASFDMPYRVIGRAFVNESGEVPSIAGLFHGANWHERETKDFFGVVFNGHPNLKPLLLAEEDVDLKPLLKSEKKLKNVEDVSWQK